MRDYLKLQLTPAWELVNSTREYVLAMLTHTIGDAAMASQVALAAHELVENAMKYSAPGQKIRMHLEERSGALLVTVENEARKEDIANLISEITAVCETKDPMGYYRSKIELAITRTDGRACLGLARIRFESQMQIKWTVAGRRVRISAIRRLDEARHDHSGTSTKPGRWLDG
ncbi:MAG TPA: hypothetical protein VHB97_03170 [Polyangia bacterium]|jgi:hypothetical protein|nr:hypothetical protein [Polyangia bacterium]